MNTLIAIYFVGYALQALWLAWQLHNLEEAGPWDLTWVSIILIVSVAWPLLLAFEIIDALRGGK